MILENSPALVSRVWRNVQIAGFNSYSMVCTAAICIAVGNTSLDDCPLFTSSLGWTLRLAPRLPPNSSEARFASTSFIFMFVWVPDPVCHITNGNSFSWQPSITSSAAWMMAVAISVLSKPKSLFTLAATRLTRASALISAYGIFSFEILKFCRERCVCAPHSALAGTFTMPILSCSSR